MPTVISLKDGKVEPLFGERETLSISLKSTWATKRLTFQGSHGRTRNLCDSSLKEEKSLVLIPQLFKQDEKTN